MASVRMHRMPFLCWVHDSRKGVSINDITIFRGRIVGIVSGGGEVKNYRYEMLLNNFLYELAVTSSNLNAPLKLYRHRFPRPPSLTLRL